MEAQKNTLVEGIKAYNKVSMVDEIGSGVCIICHVTHYYLIRYVNKCCNTSCNNIVCEDCFINYEGPYCEVCNNHACGDCSHCLRQCVECGFEECERCREISRYPYWTKCKECEKDFCGYCLDNPPNELCAKCTAAKKDGSSEEGNSGSD